MNLNLRQAILQRVENKSTEEIAKLIEDSIGGDEKALPGLGVLFEVIWEHTEKDIQIKLSDTLKNNLTEQGVTAATPTLSKKV